MKSATMDARDLVGGDCIVTAVAGATRFTFILSDINFVLAKAPPLVSVRVLRQNYLSIYSTAGIRSINRSRESFTSKLKKVR